MTTEHSSTPTVRIAGLSHFFGTGDNRQQVLSDVTVDIHPGEIVMLTGPSGAGKTTLLTLIGALRSLQEGSLSVLDRDYSTLGRTGLMQARRQIGFIFQAHNLFSSLTAFQNVRMALELHDCSPQEMANRIQALLTRLGLGDRMTHKPEALSGGQKQRVAVARALANRPRLILADEPTAALDETSATNVIGLLREMAHDDGATVIMVTHDDRMMTHADRVIHMIDGRIATDERPNGAAT